MSHAQDSIEFTKQALWFRKIGMAAFVLSILSTVVYVATDFQAVPLVIACIFFALFVYAAVYEAITVLYAQLSEMRQNNQNSATKL